MSRPKHRPMFTVFTQKLHNKVLFSPDLFRSGDLFLRKKRQMP